MLITQVNTVLVANESNAVCTKLSKNKLINADCNGAANIGVKSNLNGVYPGQTLRHLWLCH
ncbi:hypothetical protein CYANOKiyG1_69270 [Okeania sp. KiyG1]|nr:hypothetical protein CYANOKiyG1_69270 [Okeania sp. KiyG1]